MTLVRRFYPFAEIDTLHRQMNRLFDEINAWDQVNTNIMKPAVELLDKEDNLIFRVVVPGIDKKDLDISVTRDQVHISGEYHQKKENNDKGYYISEFSYGKFERTVKLPVAIQNDQVTAEYHDGILTLNLPKVEEVKNKVFKVNLEANSPALEAENKVENNQ